MNLTDIITALQADKDAVVAYVKTLTDAAAAKDAQIADLTAQLATAQANAVTDADKAALTQVDTDLKALVPPVQA